MVSDPAAVVAGDWVARRSSPIPGHLVIAQIALLTLVVVAIVLITRAADRRRQRR